MDSNFPVVLVSLGFFLIFIPKLDPTSESRIRPFSMGSVGWADSLFGAEGKGQVHSHRAT